MGEQALSSGFLAGPDQDRVSTSMSVALLCQIREPALGQGKGSNTTQMRTAASQPMSTGILSACPEGTGAPSTSAVSETCSSSLNRMSQVATVHAGSNACSLPVLFSEPLPTGHAEVEPGIRGGVSVATMWVSLFCREKPLSELHCGLPPGGTSC